MTDSCPNLSKTELATIARHELHDQKLARLEKELRDLNAIAAVIGLTIAGLERSRLAGALRWCGLLPELFYD